MLGALLPASPRPPRGGPEQANRLRQAVPMWARVPGQTRVPGHFEVDLVHHCGGSTAGSTSTPCRWSMRPPAGASGWRSWTQPAGDGGRFPADPGPLALPGAGELHPDNGGEFFNDHLVRFWGEQITGLTPSRSRPYHKNDNRIVEQKNDTLVRAYLGYGRPTRRRRRRRSTRSTSSCGATTTCSQPVLHLAEKALADGKLRRKWDTATTPRASAWRRPGCSPTTGGRPRRPPHPDQSAPGRGAPSTRDWHARWPPRPQALAAD
ncbi:MAG: hypothetical protein U0841_30215 [Chloroflexia bacterium]